MRAGRWVLAAILFAPFAAARAADPSALWNIVHGQCVPDEETNGQPAPCAEVDLEGGVAKGFAVLKDIRGASQFLLIPTARIGGIEDPEILAPDATNYWQAAWQAQSFVDDRLHTILPREAVSLAINSELGRTQNQLHIHVDCVSPEVRDALAANLDKTTDQWTPFPVPLKGHRYRAIRIAGATLDGVNPFRVLADAEPTGIGMDTLVVVGVTFADGRPGFVLLNDRADLALGNRGSGEELQDHSCAIAGLSPAQRG